MRDFFVLLCAEWKKLQKGLILSLLLIGPILSTLVGLTSLSMDIPADMPKWIFVYQMTMNNYAWLFYPIMTGVFAALICRNEHTQGAWKLLFTWPISRSSVWLSKATILMILTALSQLLFLGMYYLLAITQGFAENIEATVVWRSAFSGWIAVLPVVALQLWVSHLWKSFGVPLVINILLSIPNIFTAQSEQFSPWYPWSQPYSAMIPEPTESGILSIEPMTLWVVIFGGFLLAFGGGWLHTTRRDWT
ncbi:ABC transporter permease [Melghirimyces algeriensis]|uniref:ABC-2 type transport system permease protein n=1 Tax=Melghirimyces algeriensis TaxID=910412 RepID=A0A521ACY4_9BACL|nr:ABC transporter permease [Melghirimyces algeriensis]SMO32673.1 hypothetical protein SAMN06264849_10160 [Melghirimyces algeriensis]